MLVLLVVALLSALVLACNLAAFRGEAIASGQSSRLMGRLALEAAEAVVLGDLRAELKAGSVSPQMVPSLYYPATSWSVVPWRSSGLPPNLVKQSRSGGVFYDETTLFYETPVYPQSATNLVPIRAIAASSAAASLNVRGVNGARWNGPLLLPRGTTGAADDLTPASTGFARVDGADAAWSWYAPDWILVTKGGANPTTWSGALRSRSAERADLGAVVARFAYQIYDEGGLLDLNAAGYDPSFVPTTSASRKGSVGLADLRELNFGSRALVGLVAWRNQGVLRAGDVAPFGNRVLNYLFNGNKNGGFLRIANDGDRAFYSRQAMIKMVRALGGSAAETEALTDSLQYLTHFSRALEQPSVRPGVYDAVSKSWKLPEIVPPASGWPDVLYPSEVAADLDVKDVRRLLNLPYEMALGNNRGGNDAWGTFAQRGQAGAGRLQDAINPGLLEVRVVVPFTRRDGTQAVIGEPLIRQRFALSRLAWLTCKGPSALLPKVDPLYNADGTPDAIKAWFGLEWTAEAGLAYLGSDAPITPPDEIGSFFWRYDHSKRAGAVPAEGIGRLQQVAADGREPDFFELLKAGILVGSLGKAAMKQHVGMEGWAHDPATVSQLRDKDPSNQVLEIGANIIDQFDADSFPTIIKIGGTTLSAAGVALFVPTSTARGIENLPYLYRLHWRAVENAVSPASPKVTSIREITSSIANFVGDGFYPGTTSLIAFPELWNPHAPPVRLGSGSMRLRVVAVGEDPEGASFGGNALRPFFPMLGTRWKTLMQTGAATDRHAHFASWPSGAYAFSLASTGKSTKTFFHDRRFSSSYEFYGVSSDADDSHSARLGTNAPAEPSSYLFWPKVPAGSTSLRFAIEGFAFWKLLPGAFYPAGTPQNDAPPVACRGSSFRGNASGQADDSAPVWFVPADGRVARSWSVPPVAQLHADDPLPTRIELRNSELRLELPLGLPTLFREPTTLCSPGLPEGTALGFGAENFFQSAPYFGVLRGSEGGNWVGFSLGEVPSQFISAQRLVSAPKTTITGTPVLSDVSGAASSFGTLWRFFQVPVNLVGQRNWCTLKLRLQYQDPNSGKWITYDERFLGMDGRMVPDAPPYQGQWNAVPVEGKLPALAWANPMLSVCDPRTSRFGATQRYAYNWQNAVIGDGTLAAKALQVPLSATGGGITDRPKLDGTSGAMAALGSGPAQFNQSWVSFKAAMDQDPATLASLYQKLGAWWAVRSLVQCPSQNANDYGWISRFGNPATFTTAAPSGARGFPHFWEDYSHDAGSQESTETGKWQYWADSFRQGWLSENVAPDATHFERQAYADPDDVVRRAMGGHAGGGAGYGSAGEGLALAQLPGARERNRPVILDRPFRSVAELGVVFRGAPWKQLDFSAPETGDAALLDLFCVSEPVAGGSPLVAGRVNLNTRQEVVLRALLAGALKDERDEAQCLEVSEVNAAARALVDRTTGVGFAKGPLGNLSELAGRVVGCNIPAIGMATPPNVYTASVLAPTKSCAGLYTSVAPATSSAPGRNPAVAVGVPLSWTFTGFSADLDAVFSKSADAKVQRMRESVVRALVDAGQTRVWNLLLDVIVQTGHYPLNAAGARQFMVAGETRAWIHLAIDRLTGEVLERQVEFVAE